jgi:glutamyl-tRNA reductase
MNLLLIGVNHQTAGLAARERLAFAPTEMVEVLAHARRHACVCEAVLLSTCNRTEFYVVATDVAAAEQQLRDAVLRARALDLLAAGPHRYVRTGADVAEHLFRVAASLDSLVLGDVQILGQVKDAYAVAREAGAAGPVLDRLFECALHAGKRARAETAIGVGTVSIPAVAVETAAMGLCGLEDRHVVVLGAGETARLAALHAAQCGPASLTIVNRGPERGQALAVEVGGDALPLGAIGEAIARADVVFAATRAPVPVITRAHVEAAMRTRPGRPLWLMDLAVPRDIEAAATDVPGVVLHAIDDLRVTLDQHLATRTAQVPRVEQIVSEEAARFAGWMRSLGSTSTLVALRDHFERVRRDELERALACASADERARAERLTRALINRLLHVPTLRLKDADPASLTGRSRLEAVQDLFALSGPAPERLRRRDA